jgi:hypothetical protein
MMAGARVVRFSRRQVIGQLAAAAGFGAAFVAEAQPAWRRLKPGAWPVVVAVPDALSIDFAQLLEGFSAREFSVDEAAFGRMLEASAVDAGRLGARVLFGLRGCRLVEGASDPLGRTAPALRLAEAQIDHEDFRCVIGVWVRGEGFWASPASTVPHVSYLHDQRRRVLRGQMDRARTICNQAASGVYKYKVGSHRNWRAEVQPGAFRQASTMAVVRTLDGGELSVRRDRAWAFEGPELGENIHAATPDGDVLYVAAGCQVLPGGYSADRTAPDGNWRAFRVAAGLSAAPGISREIQGETECVQSTDDATPSCAPPFNETLDDLAMGRGVFDYVLVSGRELRMAAEDAGRARDAGARRLRRGSRGAEVARLQAQLNRSRGSGEPALAESGLFDAATQRQLIFAHQLALTGGADGILTRAEGYRLGLSGIFT